MTTAPASERLVEFVHDLGVPYLRERSIRLAPGYLGGNRFLITVDPAAIRQNAAERLFVLCRRLEMPEEAARQIWPLIREARCVHFGYEENRGREIYKVYLEQPVPPLEESPSFLLHLAFKWDLAQPDRHVVSRYVWHRGLTMAQMLDRIGPEGGALLGPLLQRAPAVDYLEVTENGNPRQSFDLNLYDCGFRIGDARGMVEAIGQRFRLDSGALHAWLTKNANEPLGHVAGGVHRNGEPFFTLYYGVVQP